MKILIVKMFALGDVFVTTPMFKLIKEKYPSVKIHHLVSDECKIVTENNPFVDKQIKIKFSNKDKNILIKVFYFLKLYHDLKKEKYDFVFIFHRNFNFQLLFKLLGVPKIFGFESKINLFLSNSLKYNLSSNRTLQEYLLIKKAGFKINKPIELSFYPNVNNINNLITNNLPKKYIAINIGGGNKMAPATNRMWPAKLYKGLIDKLNEPIVLLGNGKTDFDLSMKLEKSLNKKIINLVNKTNLDETAIILEKSMLYIGNDSSLLFLAAAMKTSTLGLYGPTQRDLACPLGNKQYTIVGHSICSPCYNPFEGMKGKMFICKNNICMQSISVEKVYDKIQEIKVQ